MRWDQALGILCVLAVFTLWALNFVWNRHCK